MNIKILFLVFVSVNTLIASNITIVDNLINKINNTKNSVKKQQLVVKLNKKVESLNQREFYEAFNIIKEKLEPLNNYDNYQTF